MVYSHSFEDTPDGDICMTELEPDLSTARTEPAVLFSAKEAPWAKPVPFAEAEFGIKGDVYFTDLFVSTLEQSAETYENAPDFLPMLGTAYVKFFYHNPVYFDFLFSRKNIRINLSLDCAGEKELPPLKILMQTAIQTFCKFNMPEPIMQNKIIAMWALVHGLSAIATMPNVEYDKDWETRIEEIIQSI